MTSNIYQELKTDEEIISFIESYCNFDDDRLYILSVMARPKENEFITHGSIPMFREIITTKSAIKTKYNKLKILAENYIPKETDDNLCFRFYITANARDIDKSYYLYQKKLLEFQRQDNNGHTEIKNKMKRLDKEWKSILQKKGNKKDSYFIIDIDKKSQDTFKRIYNGLESETNIITSISTPNGYHIITEPFEYPKLKLIDEEYIDIKTDGLLFLSIIY